jgi:hypothetical protein
MGNEFLATVSVLQIALVVEAHVAEGMTLKWQYTLNMG